MKLEKLFIDNIGKFQNFEIEFNSGVTRLIGSNGAGKTSIFNAIWSCLIGISEKGSDYLIADRYKMIGKNGVTGKFRLHLIDEKINSAKIEIENKVTKTGNQISFKAPDNYPVNLDSEWIKGFFSVAFMSATNFCNLDSKKQALLLDIDVSKFDEKIKQLKSKYTEINARYRSYGELIEPEKVEKFTDLKEFEDFNKAQRDKQQKIDQAKSRLEQLNEARKQQIEHVEFCKKQLQDAENKLNKIFESIESGQKYIIELPKPEDEKPLKEIQEQNDKYNIYKKYLIDKSAQDKEKNLLIENKEHQSKIEQDKIEYIKSFKFGFDNLSINESGELLLNDRPIKPPYFSHSELELIVAKLYISQNPIFSVRFLDDFDLVDENNQKKILTDLSNSGFQIITAEIRTSSKDNNCVILKDCRIENGKQETLL